LSSAWIVLFCRRQGTQMGPIQLVHPGTSCGSKQRMRENGLHGLMDAQIWIGQQCVSGSQRNSPLGGAVSSHSPLSWQIALVQFSTSPQSFISLLRPPDAHKDLRHPNSLQIVPSGLFSTTHWPLLQTRCWHELAGCAPHRAPSEPGSASSVQTPARHTRRWHVGAGCGGQATPSLICVMIVWQVAGAVQMPLNVLQLRSGGSVNGVHEVFAGTVQTPFRHWDLH
jgi:hypothetical protein